MKNYEVQPVELVDQQDTVLHNKIIPMTKVLWKNNHREEITWELEATMWKQYSHLFDETGKLKF